MRGADRDGENVGICEIKGPRVLRGVQVVLFCGVVPFAVCWLVNVTFTFTSCDDDQVY